MDGTFLSPEQCEKLFECEGDFAENIMIPDYVKSKLEREIEQYASGTLEKSNLRNLTHVKEEEDRLDKWTEDMVYALEKELVNIKTQIRDIERQLRTATSTTEHLQLQERLQDLSKKKRTMVLCQEKVQVKSELFSIILAIIIMLTGFCT